MLIDEVDQDTNMSLAELQFALNLIDLPVLFVSPTLKLLGANVAAKSLLKGDGSRRFLDYLDPGCADEFSASIEELIDEQLESTSVVIRYRNHSHPVTVKVSRMDELIVVAQQHEGSSPKLSHEALATDHLTGLQNRRALDERLAKAISGRERSWGLLFLDLDNYKIVNDQLGHVFGDRVLREYAAVLAKHSRPQDLIARYGGDEFVVFVEKVESQGDLDRIAQRISQDVVVEVSELIPPVTISASIGAVMAWDGLQEPSEIIAAADKAMYAAKARRS